MSLALLLPLGLLALAAWVLPLLLHLARREQQQPTDFAALRWLGARLTPRQRLRFEELPLLALRLLLVAALALLLAKPVLTGLATEGEVVLVHPALAASASLRPDAGDARDWRWLAPGFPSVDGTTPPRDPADGTANAAAVPHPTASLLREIDAELAAGRALTVHVPAWFDGADGARIRLSRTVDWRVEPVAPPVPGDAGRTPAPTLAVRHDDAHAAQVRYLRATVAAWGRTAVSPGTGAAEADIPLPDIAGIDAPLPEATTAIAWLAAGGLPAPLRTWIDAGGTVLIADDTTWPLAGAGMPLWRDGDGDVLASAAPLGRGRVVRLHRPLQPARMPALLEAEFPQRLRALLQAPPPAPARADAMLLAPLTGGAGYPPRPRPVDDWLVALVLALFAGERWLAAGRRSGGPA